MMSPKEQAQHLANALQFTRERIAKLEHELYTTPGKRQELLRLHRVQRALNRDLDKLVRTIPAPIQFNFFDRTDDDAPRVAASQLGQKLSEEDRGDHPSRQSVQANTTPPERMS